MAIGKKLSKSAALYGQGQGSTPDIEMAPLGYNIDDRSNYQPIQEAGVPEKSDSVSLFKVPDQVPSDVLEEMQQQSDPEISESEPNAVQQPVQEVRPSKNSEQENFKNLRLAKEKAERERDALMQQMLSMYQQQKVEQQKVEQPQVHAAQIDEDIDFSIDEDALVEGKYVKKVVNEIKNLKSQLKNYQSQTQEIAIETKIKNNFPDFEKVVSKENVESLNTMFPEVAQSLRDTQDLYSKAAAAYRIMKSFGIYKDAYEEDKAKALKNAAKPRPLASVSPQQGDSPLSKANAFANGMTEELKEQLRKEMYAARRSL